MINEQPEPRPGEPDVWDDPVVEEVRAIRRRLWEEAGRDMDEYIRRAREATERFERERAGDSFEAA